MNIEIEIEISEELHERLTAHAKSGGRSVDELVDAALASPPPITAEPDVNQLAINPDDVTTALGALAEPAPIAEAKPDKPTHYKIVCISLYTSDIEDLDAKVDELKRRGLTKMSRSQLIRIALRRLNLDDVTRGDQ